MVISTDYCCCLPIHHCRHDRICLDQSEQRQVAIIPATFVLPELPSPANLHQRQRHVMRDVMIHVTRRMIVYAPSCFFFNLRFSGHRNVFAVFIFYLTFNLASSILSIFAGSSGSFGSGINSLRLVDVKSIGSSA